jgi:cytochrome c oxidase subunit 4
MAEHIVQPRTYIVIFLALLWFMHVRYSTRLTWIVVIAGFFWLGILLALTMSDYISRGWLGTPTIQ